MVQRVTGSMKVIDWKSYAKSSKHLEKINFPYLGKTQIIDMLTGMDYVDLHFSC